jgi:hypothetical protein
VSTGERLAAFAALLAVVFGVAAVAGGAIGPDRAGQAARDEGHGHGGMTMAAAAPVRGLAVAADGLRLELATTSLPRDRTTTLRFRILGDHDRPLRRFDVEHEKRLHLIVVRRDAQGFQHLHPTMAPDGTWSAPLRLPAAGSYRVFADFVTNGNAHTLGADLSIDGAATYAPLPAPARHAPAGDAYTVRLDGAAPAAGRPGALRFTVLRDGRPVRTQPYLGAGGHLVALREGDLAYLHTHPDGSTAKAAVPFETTFPTRGRYRLFFQFRHAGAVHTAAFTTEVA